MSNPGITIASSSPHPIFKPQWPSLVLPNLQGGALALTPKSRRLPSSTFPELQNTEGDAYSPQEKDNSAKISHQTPRKQGNLMQGTISEQLEKDARNKFSNESQSIISKSSHQIDETRVRFSLYHGLSKLYTSDTPRVVDEQDSYWVVQMPVLQLSTGIGSPSGSQKYNKTEELSCELIGRFLREKYREKHFPVLSSRQYNFGLVFYLEDSWAGLNIVAKSEEAYLKFEALVELQLVHCYVECFVKGPSLQSVTKLFGKTATGSADLCIDVINSRVLGTTRCTNTCQFRNTRSSLPSGSTYDVISHVIFQISFPPVFLPEILLCNDITLITSSYLERGTASKGLSPGNPCVFAISFPHVHCPGKRGRLHTNLYSVPRSVTATLEDKQKCCIPPLSKVLHLVSSFRILSCR